MKPGFGKIVSVSNDSVIIVDEDNQKDFKYTGNSVVMGNNVRCATYTYVDGNVYAQPWTMVSGYSLPGERNLGAVLNNQQVRKMVEMHIKDKVSPEQLSTQFGVSVEQCTKIITGQAWFHITKNYIKHLRRNGDPGVVATNKPKARRKLSENLIAFILKDKENKISNKDLAKKYCVSVRQIQRIVKGDAWKNQSKKP